MTGRNGRGHLNMGLALVTAGVLAACVPQPEDQPSGRALYGEFCASCHGAGGMGDGPTAALLPKAPADLTGISARNGGRFPLARVMSTIDGYSRLADHASIMPEMGPVLQQGRPVMVDTGDGVQTPVPPRLLALARYVESLQK